MISLWVFYFLLTKECPLDFQSLKTKPRHFYPHQPTILSKKIYMFLNLTFKVTTKVFDSSRRRASILVFSV